MGKLTAQLFAPPYSEKSANEKLGIPLKTSANIDETTNRSTIEETYKKITDDLLQSINLLPSQIIYKTRPSKAAAYALLSRTYLLKGDYNNAKKYSSLCLQIYNSLLNYNTRPYNGTTSPFIRLSNPEIIFHAITRDGNFVFRYQTVDTALYNSYPNDDLRKKAFFTAGNGGYKFKGNYNGNSSNLYFAGITTSEIYLIKAECEARNNELTDAATDLNTLLENRWSTGKFAPITFNNQPEAVKKVLEERRKELVFRPALRWSDLRRLNLEPNQATTITRILNGKTYTLPPNDLRYTFIIPPSVISLTNMPQNPR